MIRASILGPVAFVFLVGCSAGSPAPSGTSGASGSTDVGGATGKAGAGSGGAAGSVLSGGVGGSAAGAVGFAGAGGAGAGGTGGVLATAGSAGSSGAAGGATTGCAGMALCDDFEAAADAAGATPTGWTLLNPGGCSGSAQYSATIDTSQFHSGNKSVKVTGGDSCGPLLVNTAGLAAVTGGEVYGRFFVRMPTTTAFDHAVMMALGLSAGVDVTGQFDQAKNLQLAPEQIGTTNALVWQTTDGNILPAKAPAAAPTTTFPTANMWTCIEFHVSANSSAIETWVDGTPIAGLTFIPGTTTKMGGLNDQWTPAPLAPTAFGLGWIVFSAPSISLWFDDAALGTKRIGCN